MTRKAFLRDFWRYYIHLEKRFAGSLDYVELDECNYGTFSNYYASLLQSIGAEIDHFMKVYCGYPVSERHIIDDYASSILPDEEFNITEQKVLVVGTDIVISPFKDWNSKCAAKSLFWWDAYNNVKHNRSENFKRAYNFSWGLSRPMPLVGANNIVFKKCCSKDWGSTFCFFRLVIRYILQKSVFTKWRNNLERYYHKAP